MCFFRFSKTADLVENIPKLRQIHFFHQHQSSRQRKEKITRM